MADIELRFNRDMLVLSAPVDSTLARQGIDAARDREYLNLMEPDVVLDALRLEALAGAQCLVTTTEDITRARLSHVNMDADAARLAQAALGIAAELKPQHVLAEIGPSGLPLDATSEASLEESRGQYADAARAFGDGAFDAFFLNGFANVVDMKCAIEGVRQASGKPVFASMTVGNLPLAQEAASPVRAETEAGEPPLAGHLAESYPFAVAGFERLDEEPARPVPLAVKAPLSPEGWGDAVDAMAESGAAVIGFETAEPLAKALDYARIACERLAAAGSRKPVLAQLRVVARPAERPTAKGLVPLADIDEYTPDTMEIAAMKLRDAGVQFLRATGDATPAFTGALAATVFGLDVTLGTGQSVTFRGKA